MVHNPGFLALVNDAKSRIQETDVEGYKALLAEGTDHVLIDVREDNEFAAGHVKGAVHLGRGIIERDVETLERQRALERQFFAGRGHLVGRVRDPEAAQAPVGATDLIAVERHVEWRTDAVMPALVRPLPLDSDTHTQTRPQTHTLPEQARAHSALGFIAWVG